MKFLVDAQLPPAVARWLREAGCEAEAVREIGLRDAEDDAIWRYAKSNLMAIVTKDEDFAVRVQTSEHGPSVIWLRIGNCSNAALREWLIPHLPQIIRHLDKGSRFVEIR